MRIWAAWLPGCLALMVMLVGEGRWTRLSGSPHDHAYHVLVAVSGKLYTAGGIESKVDCFDPGSGRWSTVGAVPSDRAFCGAAELGGRIYLVGGIEPRGRVYLSDVHVLEPATRRWSRGADMPTARNRLAAVNLAGRIYAIGGMKAAGDHTVNCAEVEAYDPKRNMWRTCRPMPTARHGAAALAVGGRILVIGGFGDEKAPGAVRHGLLPTVEEFDPGTNQWRLRARMPTPRAFLCAVLVNGKV